MTAAGRVTEHVIEYIRRHALKPGAVLPAETTMSAELGVSRGIVREAYRALDEIGIIETGNGRRPRVGGLTSRGLTQLLRHALATEQVSAAQILELRRPIEVWAVMLAAERRTDQDVQALRRELSAMKADRQRGDAFLRAQERFDDIICSATGNPLLGVVIRATRQSMAIHTRVGVRRPRTHRIRAIALYEDILEAIVRGQPGAARLSMERHRSDA